MMLRVFLGAVVALFVFALVFVLTPATPPGDGEAPTAWQAPHVSPDRADRSRAVRWGIPAGHGNTEGARPGRPADSARRPLPAVLLRIRSCESGNDYRAENPTSTASGAWQILDGTWNHYLGYARAVDAPRAVQDRRALQLWLDRGTEPWDASAGCWR